MAQLEMSFVVLAWLAVKAAGILVLVYAGSRLAIRHEREAAR